MMSDARHRVPILWVDVYNPNQIPGTKMFNKVLREQAAVRGNTTVLSWFDLASDPSEKILRTDHIHPNAGHRSVSPIWFRRRWPDGQPRLLVVAADVDDDVGDGVRQDLDMAVGPQPTIAVAAMS